MAFQQAPIQTPLYMNIHKGYIIPRDQQNHPMVLKLLHNIYGQKKVPRSAEIFFIMASLKQSFDKVKLIHVSSMTLGLSS